MRRSYAHKDILPKNSTGFFPKADSPFFSPAPTFLQRKEEPATVAEQAAPAAQKEPEAPKAKRGSSFWKDLFTRPFKAFARLFGSENYSEKELNNYVQYLRTAKKIENRYDSDNKARAVVHRLSSFGPIDRNVKKLLILEMMKGATLGADESAIIQLLSACAVEEQNAIVAEIGRERLWKEFSGRNRRMIEAMTLAEADMANEQTQQRLQSKSEKELEDYRDHARNPKVRETVTKMIYLKRISTPLDLNTQFNAQGEARLEINGFEVVILPDQVRDQEGKGAVTNTVLSGGEIDEEVTFDGSTGNVKSWRGPTRLRLTIQTFYDRGADPSGPSGYGRGKTTEDIRAGRTSLRFHEGQHGLDALQYLRDHPPPAFTGRAGMTRQEFIEAAQSFNQAINDYQTYLVESSLKATDCAGDTKISLEQLRAVGVNRNICTEH